MAQVLESLQLKWDPGRSSWLLASTWTSLSCCQHLRSISLDERFLVPTVALPFRHKSIFKKKQHFYLLSLQQYGAQKACIVMLSKAFSLFYLPAPWVKASHSQDIDGLLWEAWYAMRNHREVEGPPRRTQTLSRQWMCRYLVLHIAIPQNYGGDFQYLQYLYSVMALPG